MTELIFHRGAVVPWVAKWSDEDIPDQPFHIQKFPSLPPERRHLLVLDPSSPLDRDSRGALWARDGMSRTGTPWFGTLHARRQRLCITKPRCQVCGRQLPRTDIPWLFSRYEFDDIVAAEADPVTATPPTCEDCWDLASRLCPHLQAKDHVAAHVGRAVPWGIIGDLYTPNGIRHPRRAVPFDSHYGIRMTVAKQFVVTLHDLKPETGALSG